MQAPVFCRWVAVLALCGLLWDCAPKRVSLEQLDQLSEDEAALHAAPLPKAPVIPPWTERVLTEAELKKLEEMDAALTRPVSLEILARLNIKDPVYIAEAIKKKHKLKVPNDFRAFKNWTPLPRRLPGMAGVPKLVMVVKDIPFIGWYEKGKLTGDAHACIGKKSTWTKSGSYKVLEKDRDHISASYSNAYGLPALMPFALRIYGRVWIHGGDIVGAYCSHGCINLPLDPAERLFDWADQDTAVLVVESFRNMDQALQQVAQEEGKARQSKTQ